MRKTLERYLGEQYLRKDYERAKSYGEQRRRLKKPTNIQIAVLGDGDVGVDIMRVLSSIEPVYDLTQITKLFFYGSDPDKTRYKLSFSSDIPIEYCSYNELKKRKNEAHIAIITRDNRQLNGDNYLKNCLAEKQPPQRHILGKNNIKKTIETAQLMQGFNGLVLMVSNHVNLLSHVFQIYSGLDPRQIVGLSHTDTCRFRNELGERFRNYTERPDQHGNLVYILKNIEAFVIGLHDFSMVPVFSEAYLLGININHLDFFKANTPTEVYKEVTTRGFKQFLATAGRLPSPGEAVEEVIKAILDEACCVSNAVYIDFKEPIFNTDRQQYKELIPKRGLWMGLPHFFWDFKAELLPRGDDENLLRYVPNNVMEWFKRLHPADKHKFFEGAKRLETMLEEWEKEKLIEPVLVKKASEYYFVGNSLKEEVIAEKIKEELMKDNQETGRIISKKLQEETEQRKGGIGNGFAASYEKARKLYDSGDYEGAKNLFHKVIVEGEDNSKEVLSSVDYLNRISLERNTRRNAALKKTIAEYASDISTLAQMVKMVYVEKMVYVD